MTADLTRVDPELLPALEVVPEMRLTGETLAEMRAMLGAMFAAPDHADLPSLVEERRIVAAAGNEVVLVIHRPRAPARGPLPAVLHIHGGGYILGSALTMLDGPAAMAAAVGCVVVSVDYRLAPETRHPGPLEDCYAGLAWLAENAGALGVDATRIAVAGESAGGGLAAALALLARDRGQVALCHQHLTYPMIDDRTCTRPPVPHKGDHMWTAESNLFGWTALLGRAPGGDDVPAYAAAARAEDLRGLPPTFIHVGDLDLFAVEDMTYAARLIAAGVPTECHLYPGAFHGFEMAVDATVTRTATAASLNALRRAFAR